MKSFVHRSSCKIHHEEDAVLDILSVVEKHSFPATFLRNLDQNPFKYIPVMNHTMAKKNSTLVPIIE